MEARKIKGLLTSPDSILHSQFVAGAITLIIIFSTSFIFPGMQARYQRIENDLRLKQETMRTFSKNITQTINYLDTAREFACLSAKESDQDKIKSFQKRSDEYYDKFNSLDPSYEVSCVLIEIYFDETITAEAQQIKEMLDDYTKLDGKICTTDNDKYKTSVYDKYEELIKRLAQQLK